MTLSPESDSDQLGELDKETLVSIILALRQTVIEQAAIIQSLRDQPAKNSPNSRMNIVFVWEGANENILAS